MKSYIVKRRLPSAFFWMPIVWELVPIFVLPERGGEYWEDGYKKAR